MSEKKKLLEVKDMYVSIHTDSTMPGKPSIWDW